MASIQGSVGQGGNNFARDVVTVKRLLAKHDLRPLPPLDSAPAVDAAFVKAIRRFQTVYVGLSSPDGRVDPGGRTLRRLNAGSPASPLPKVGESPQTRQEAGAARSEFVDPRVKETSVTTRILDALAPRFAGVRAKVISAYLSDTDLFWKVNYHWDYLRDMLEHVQTLPLPRAVLDRAGEIRSTLIAVSPRPASGYLTSPVGRPADSSSMQEMTQRHTVVSQAKRDFKALIASSEIRSTSRRTPKSFDYAVAPVAHPGSSKHGTGYALDIEGDNSAIRDICKAAGATLVFDEKSHVHVEFRNGAA